MKKDEAIAILDQAVSLLQTTRENHVKLQMAIQVLKEENKEKDETTKTEATT